MIYEDACLKIMARMYANQVAALEKTSRKGDLSKVAQDYMQHAIAATMEEFAEIAYSFIEYGDNPLVTELATNLDVAELLQTQISDLVLQYVNRLYATQPVGYGVTSKMYVSIWQRATYNILKMRQEELEAVLDIPDIECGGIDHIYFTAPMEYSEQEESTEEEVSPEEEGFL